MGSVNSLDLKKWNTRGVELIQFLRSEGTILISVDDWPVGDC